MARYSKSRTVTEHDSSCAYSILLSPSGGLLSIDPFHIRSERSLRNDRSDRLVRERCRLGSKNAVSILLFSSSPTARKLSFFKCGYFHASLASVNSYACESRGALQETTAHADVRFGLSFTWLVTVSRNAVTRKRYEALLREPVSRHCYDILLCDAP